MASFTYTQLQDPNQVQPLGEILCQCFHFSPSKWETYHQRLGIDNFRLLYQGKELVGGLGFYPIGHWFGNNQVPTTGVAAVGVAPQFRGTGAARTLMHHALKEIYNTGTPLSTLYPATQRLYRSVGYDQGGSYCQWQIPLATLCASSRDLPVEAISNPQPDYFTALYRQAAQKINGYLDRNLALWQTILDPQDNQLYAYWVGDRNHRQGYIIFEQKVVDKQLCLVIRDWVATTPAAMSRLWTFLADHRSQVKYCRWHGGMVEPKLLLLPEQTATLLEFTIWLVRIVDVPKALQMRAYPKGIEAELHLAIEDPLFAANAGNYRLTVAEGQGKVIPGGKGELRLEVKALASLYTGFFTAQQLQRMGKLEGSETAITLATQLFSLPSPSLAEFF
jgi:predicted acetyltransferase